MPKETISANDKLQSQNLKLQYKIEQLQKELELWGHSSSDSTLEDELRKTVYTTIAKSTVYDKQQAEFRKLISHQIMKHPQEFFKLTDSILSPNESRIYYSLKIFFAHYSNTLDKAYHIFPQVSMHTIIDSNPLTYSHMISKIANALEIPEALVKETISRKYMSKSIDFLVCLCLPSDNKYKEKYWYSYKPVIGIEIDGMSHSTDKYGIEALNAQKIRDKEKDKIFEALGIPLIRYQLKNDEINKKSDYESLKTIINSVLPW